MGRSKEEKHSSKSNKKYSANNREKTEIQMSKKNRVDRKRESSESSNELDSFTPMLDKHHCTDIICTVLFLVFIVILAVLSYFAYATGDPASLIKPHDSEGNICGSNKKYLFFFDLTKCLSVMSLGLGCPTKQICVSSCPNVTSINGKDLEPFCDPKNITNCPSYILKSSALLDRCIPAILAKFTDTLSNEIIKDETSNQTINITQNGNSETLTLGTLFEASKYLKNLVKFNEFTQAVYNDLSKSYWFILIALVAGTVLAFIWMILLRFIIKPIIWITILAVLALNAFGTYFCVTEYLILAKNSTNVNEDIAVSKLLDFDYLTSLKETWLAFSIILGVILLIVLLVVIFLRKRLNMAAELIKEASKAITSIPSALVWPLLPFLLQLGVIFYCASIALYLASAGVPIFKIVDSSINKTASNHTVQFKEGFPCDPIKFNETKMNDSSLNDLDCIFYKIGYDPEFFLKIFKDSSNFKKYSYTVVDFVNKYQWIPQVFVLFMFFWLISFVLALNEMTLAGAFGAWYWTRFKNADKTMKNKLPFFTVLGSLGRTLFYHLGTLAFGSLLIAIVKIIRTIIEYFSNKFKSETNKSKIAKFIVACCKCCFWCLEKFMKFLNKNAFIITAVYSLNFCSAASKAFKLITTNFIRFAVVDKTTGFVLFLSNLMITSVIGILGFCFFTNKFDLGEISAQVPELNYYFVPLVVIVIGVFVITKLFFDVFSMGVDTLLMCVLIDCDENDGSSEKPYFMSKNLKKLLKIK